MKKRIAIALVASALCLQGIAQPVAMVVNVNEVKASVQPTMLGAFFEDINFGADGGLYAEMVKNRSFEFPMPMAGWREIKKEGNGKILIENRGQVAGANARYAHVTVNAGGGTYGLSNEGFRGMGFQKGETYNFSVLLKKSSGNLKLRVEAINFSGKKIGEAMIDNLSNEWKSYRVSFTTTDTSMKGKLNVWFEGSGEADVDQISLFPKNTWKNRPNGMRAD